MSGDHDACPKCGAGCFWCSCGDAQQPGRAENERMIQDHIRLCTALGLDADAHIDMLAEAAERLRAALEPLAEIASMYAISNSDDESAYVTLGLLRRAAAALLAREEKKEE